MCDSSSFAVDLLNELVRAFTAAADTRSQVIRVCQVPFQRHGFWTSDMFKRKYLFFPPSGLFSVCYSRGFTNLRMFEQKSYKVIELYHENDSFL